VERRTVQSDPTYAAMIENLDANVGRLLDALAAAGKSENTIVIFTSDNGGLATSEGSPTTNLPLAEGKGWMKDGGVRVPLIVSWPRRVESGWSTDAITTSPDLYPTLLAAAGLAPRPEQHVDGANVIGQWIGAGSDRGPIYWHYPHYSNQGGTPGAAVRDGDLKLIRYYEDGRQELFDLARDIEELHDIGESRPGEVARLGRLLDSWSDDVSAIIPRPNTYPNGLEAQSQSTGGVAL
jgi:arylsulfatase A-like enzyme